MKDTQLALDTQLDHTDLNHATPIPVLPHEDDDNEVEPLMPPTPPNPDITTPPAPRPLHHSSQIPIPTEQHPTGGPSTTCTEEAIQESMESAAHVKEMCWAHWAAKHAGSQDDHPNTSADGNDIIDDLQLMFENLDLGDHAHDLLVMILEMDFDPESLQLKMSQSLEIKWKTQ